MDGETRRSVNKWLSIVSYENPELLKIAQEELNEHLEQRDQHIQTLRDLVLGEENLISPTDDAFLLKFLRARKFNIDRAFTLVKQYYSVRKKFPSLFTNYRPSSVLNILNNRIYINLPYRDQLGRTVIIGRFGTWNPRKSTVDEVLKLMHICIEHALIEEESQVNGVVCLADLKHFGVIQARHATPSNARKLAAILQDCLPARFKGFHVVFEPAIFDLAFMVVKPFLSKKTSSRFFFHGGNLESLHQHIHREFLPEEYGGLKPSVETAAELQVQTLLGCEEEIVKHMENSGYHVAGERD